MIDKQSSYWSFTIKLSWHIRINNRRILILIYKNIVTNSLENKPDLSQRIICLLWALGVFYCLYPLTNLYSEVLSHTRSFQPVQVISSIDGIIPFIEWMIIPYSWSLILFIASFFIVSSIRQLHKLTICIILATLAACLCFYLFPFQFSYPRPSVSPIFAQAYQFLETTDRPYNQVPSLHVAYALIFLVCLWHSKFKMPIFLYRTVLLVICGLIIVSTLFTYQHHFIDLVGGVVLAALIIGLSYKVNSLLALRFLTIGIAGYLIINIAAFINFNLKVQFLTHILAIYILLSFLLIAFCYQTNRTHLFRKNSYGQLVYVSWLTFAPLLAAYWLISKCRYCFLKNQNLKYFQIKLDNYREDAFTKIKLLATPKFQQKEIVNWINEEQVIQQNSDFNHNHNYLLVVDCTCELSSHYLDFKNMNDNASFFNQIDYLYVPLLDLQPFDKVNYNQLVNYLEKIKTTANKIITNNTTTSNAISKKDRHSLITPLTVYINFHCTMGWSRSIALLICYLIYQQKLLPEEKEITRWLKEFYPKSHIKSAYLSLSLLQRLWHENESRCGESGQEVQP